MIKRLEVTNWKQLQNRVVAFEPGLNFVLGSNGSGKSSVLQAIAFALSGTIPGTLAPKDAIQMGASGGATVSLVLNGPVAPATISRSIDRSGTITTEVQADSIDFKSESEDISRLLGTEFSDIARLLFFNEGDIYLPSASHLDLDRHLETLLAIGPLQQLMERAGDERRSLTRLLKTQRSQLRLSKDEVSELSQRRAQLEADLQSLEDSEPAVLEREREMDSLVRSVNEYRAANAARSQWMSEAEQLLGRPLVDEDLQRHLDELRNQIASADQTVRELLAQRGRLEGDIAAREAVLQLLEGGTDREVCPLCEQPLSGAHRNQVAQSQRTRLTSAAAELAELGEALHRAESNLSSLNTTVTAMHSLMARRPTIGASAVELPNDLDNQVEQSKEAARSLGEQRRQVFDELAAVRERLAKVETDRRIEEEVIEAYRRDALLEAVEDAISSFTSGLRTGLIGPLSQELGAQWKGFRPLVPWNLVLDDNGQLAIEMDGEHRPFGALSAGEKTVAVILLRIALSAAFTSAGFMVLDEPLEHLDPRARRVLVSSLHHAIETGVVKQIIVSTYEETIVRRLQQDGIANAIYL